MSSRPEWKIFYGDGSTFSDLDGSPENAPGVNVQVIIQTSKDHGREVIKGGNQWRDDYYWWDNESRRWWCGDLFGLFDHLSQKGWRKVLFGRSVNDFDEIYKAALNDPDFPPKTGWERYEPRS